MNKKTVEEKMKELEALSDETKFYWEKFQFAQKALSQMEQEYRIKIPKGYIRLLSNNDERHSCSSVYKKGIKFIFDECGNVKYSHEDGYKVLEALLSIYHPGILLKHKQYP